MTSVLVAAALAVAINPSGHWEGSVDTPQASIAMQVDFAPVNGELAGAITIPQQHIAGLPLTKIAIDGSSITFGARTDQLMAATVDDGGKTMSGTFSLDSFSFPFSLTRTGDSKLAPRPTSAPFGKELEGTWHGALADTAGRLQLLLTMVNRPDGSAVATIVNLDEGSLQLPVVVSKQGTTVTIESHVVESAFTGELNANGELVGTFHQGAFEIPLTFTRER